MPCARRSACRRAATTRGARAPAHAGRRERARPSVPAGGAEPGVGGRHHLHPHRGGLALPLRRARPVLAAGCRLERSAIAGPCLAAKALTSAVRDRKPKPGLIHHSDQGTQPGFNRSSQHLTFEVTAMSTRKRSSDKAGRDSLGSLGRPPVASREQRQRFWRAIADGGSTEGAALSAGVSPAVGARWFRHAGGMPPSPFCLSSKPPSGRYLSFAEREEIALLRAAGHGVREVARRLGRAASTISRELRRNAATRSGGFTYRATTAQWHADRAARRPKLAKLATNARLRRYVEERLGGVIAAPSGGAVAGPQVTWRGRRHGRRQPRRWAKAWSPEQIAHRLPLDFPDDAAMRISHEAIYQALYVEGRGARAAARAHRLPAHGASAAGAAGSRARSRQVVRLARAPDP